MRRCLFRLLSMVLAMAVLSPLTGMAAPKTFALSQGELSVTVSKKAEQKVADYDLSGLKTYMKRKMSKHGGQDIEIYNGKFFGFDESCMYVDGECYPIKNGHGNNCMFGDELHGDYPYLYCGSWNRDDCAIYVNRISESGAELVRTISYPTLKGYLNCCVDERNDRAYIFLCKSRKTREGDIDFIVSDLNGTILSRKSIGKIPVIQGMTFHGGKIYIVSGYGKDTVPSAFSVYDTSGNLLAGNDKPDMEGELEGVDFDGETMYIATRGAVWMS